MYEVLTGKQRSLVFPIMCNAFVKLDYSDNIPDTNSNADTSDDIAYGLWAHEGSFSFEAIVTPYDVNGFGTHQERVDFGDTNLGVGNTKNSSKKIMPNHLQEDITLIPDKLQDQLYLSRANRLTHEMMIFDNDNFKVSLINSTQHTQNNPAEYKIKVQVTIGSTTQTVTSDAVILPSVGHSFRYNSTNGASLLSGFNDKGRVMYAKVAEVATSGHSAGSATINVTSSSHPVLENVQEIFIRDGANFTSLGTVNSVTTIPATIVLSSAYSSQLADATALYLPTYKYPTYTEQMFHIGCTFNNKTKKTSIHLNGTKIKEDTHTDTGDFSFARTDIYLGSNGLNDMSVSGINDAANSGTATGKSGATTCKQFMGEMHEIAISNKIREFAEVDNLMPNYNNTLLYLRFEEVDL